MHQSRFQEELKLVAEALQSFAAMVKLKRPTFSHKQMKFLNAELNAQYWRIGWNRRGQWALVPTEENPLWGALFAPLPPKAAARRKAIDKRREALKSLASKINTIVLQCEILPSRQKSYVAEPKANKLVRDILEAVQTNPVMDNQARSLSKARTIYALNFEEQPEHVQEIIRANQRRKWEYFKPPL